jgi:hypothetical protein
MGVGTFFWARYPCRVAPESLDSGAIFSLFIYFPPERWRRFLQIYIPGETAAGGNMRHVTVTGTPDAVSMARQLIVQKVGFCVQSVECRV